MQKVKLGDICTKQSSAYAQKDLNDLEGEYPIYGASGFIKKINIYHQDKEYVAVVKDGAGIGRTMYLVVYMPPIEQQERFAAFVAQTDKSKLIIQKSLDELETLNKALMQKYFGGN